MTTISSAAALVSGRWHESEEDAAAITGVPMSAEIPDTSQREKLIPFVGSYVEITGEMFEQSRIKSIVIAQIKKADDTDVTSKK